jgi:hypothetical protein
MQMRLDGSCGGPLGVITRTRVDRTYGQSTAPEYARALRVDGVQSHVVGQRRRGIVRIDRRRAPHNTLRDAGRCPTQVEFYGRR